jgi:hypothetical protein
MNPAKSVHPRRGEMLSPPLLGVASTLRRVKSKAPALHYRAESPAINSTGQRPVWKGHSIINKPQRGEIKSNSLISPQKGEISVARRFNAGELSAIKPPAAKPRYILSLLGVASTLRRVKSKAPALHYRAESPAINSTGQRPVWNGHFLINKPQRGGIKSNNRISPFQGYGYRTPSFTGQRPVLLTTGLSALQQGESISPLRRINKIHGINGRNVSTFINS